jgi:CheY-like chemotaxis protein
LRRILIVEDNEMNRDVLSRHLIRRGYEVLIAVNGIEGIETARREELPWAITDSPRSPSR